MAKNQQELSREQVAKILEDFLEGTGSDWDWDDFTHGPTLSDGHLEEIRLRSANLSAEFLPTTRREFTSEQGRQVLRGYITELRRT